LQRDQRVSPSDAATLAHIVSAIMFLSMAATINIARSVDEILEDIRSQVRVLLPH
jgi:TetR/AcrR family transcriptional regulator